MPFIKVWIHYVWATKNREPTLVKEYRQRLFEHIHSNAKEKDIFLDRVNGHVDHVHCLVSLGSSQQLDKVAQLLKGEASFWYNNRSGFDAKRIEWQDDYFAVSVSESMLQTVRAYIDSQEQHHKKKTFAEEYEEFMQKYGFVGLG